MITSASVRYKTQILDCDGVCICERPFKRNLLLDVGLNQVASTPWANLFQYCVLGTGAKNVKRDSGAVTASRSGTTVTTGTNFFEAADVGRLLKFDSGEECYITAFTSETEVAVDTEGTVASSEFTIWYVNETSHETEAKRTNVYSTDVGDNGTTLSGDTVTLKRTFLFSAETGAVLYKEIGWASASSGNLFGRDLIPGGGDAIGEGQQFKVVVELSLKLSPATSVAVVDVNTGTGVFDTSGNASLGGIDNGSSQSISGVSSTGASLIGSGKCILEPSGTTSSGGGSTLKLEDTDFTLPTLTLGSANIGGAGLGNFNISGAGSYVSGSYTRTKIWALALGDGNGTVTGFIFTRWGYANSGFAVKFTTPQPKNSDHTLLVVLRLSWGRDLIN